MDKHLTKMNPEEYRFLRDLYEQNYAKIYNYIKIYISDANMAKDLTADVFVIACEKISTLQKHPNPEAWLYTVAKNKLKEFYNRLNSGPDIIYTDNLENIATDDDSTGSLKDLEITIHTALTPSEYDRYLRYFIWGHTLEEIASHESVTKPAMSARLSRLRHKLKDLLQIQ